MPSSRSEKTDSTCEQTQVVKNVIIQIGRQSCSSTEVNKDIVIQIGKQVCKTSIEHPKPFSYSNFPGNRKPVV